jgi:hypothetical protein
MPTVNIPAGVATFPPLEGMVCDQISSDVMSLELNWRTTWSLGSRLSKVPGCVEPSDGMTTVQSQVR